MSNYKRTINYVGRPALLEPIEREYKTIWLQPVNESQVPHQVHVYEKPDGWRGYRMNDSSQTEVFWMRGLWKEVPSPLPPSVTLEPVRDEDDEETLESPLSEGKEIL